MAQRMKYSEEILTAARQAVEDGSPMNRPLWWVAPNDTVTHTINDGKILLIWKWKDVIMTFNKILI